MDESVTDAKLPQFSVLTGASTVRDISIDEGVQAFEKVSIDSDKVSSDEEMDVSSVLHEMPETEDSKSLTTTAEGLPRSLGEILQSSNGDTDISTPSDENTVGQGYSGSSIDERRQLDTIESSACALPSEEAVIELKSQNFEQHDGSSAENQDLRQKDDQVAEEEEDSANMISKRLFWDLEVEGLRHKNKILNNQLSFQSSPNDDAGTEQVTTTASPRSSFGLLVRGDSDLIGGASNMHGSISNSTQIPYSGSLSFQSESSTTSTRSFAFPKLQAEWSNSSPVRMAKAKRGHLRKLQGWKSKFLCCRF